MLIGADIRIVTQNHQRCFIGPFNFGENQAYTLTLCSLVG
jgi:hypothetical protein